MEMTRRSIAAGVALIALVGPSTASAEFTAGTADKRKLYEEGIRTVRALEAQEPRARQLSARARAVLVFPQVVKAGFIVGGETGNGVLLMRGGRPVNYYNITGASFGLQAGGEGFSYVLYFMTPQALESLRSSRGWNAGAGPHVTVIDKNAGVHADIRTGTQDVYAFPFNNKGLMGAVAVQGTKISPIHYG